MNAQRSINWVEQGYVPDTIIRKGIRRLLRQRLDEVNADNNEMAADDRQLFISAMKQSPVALSPEKANEQHYEVPARFYELVLGDHNKYSCCFWDETSYSLTDAEANALDISCEHAKLQDGQNILELGCGWGSLTLWMAQKYPSSHITAVSNSHSQKKYILNNADSMGLTNIDVITCDMNDFSTDEIYDRVVSIEMFEHMRNWETLFGRVSGWLKDDGMFFMHIFVNRSVPYAFEVKDGSDWMSEHFFTGGMMPSHDLPLYFQNQLSINHSWTWNGKHYAQTANAWLEKMDTHKDELMPLFEKTYGKDYANIWWMRWRLFFMACAELFAFDNGRQWYVSHYLFNKR